MDSSSTSSGGEGSIRRVAVGASGPLASSARRLLDRPVDELGEIDLRVVVIVTPGRRAGRQFLVELEMQGAALERRLVPPRLTTPSGLVDVFPMNGHRRIADEETWLAAVTAALDVDLDRGDVDGSTRLLPADAGPLERRSLARRLIDADRAVRAADRDWDDVIATVSELGGDESRHRGIAMVLAEASRQVVELGLEGPEDAIDAAIEAIESAGSLLAGSLLAGSLPARSPREVVLLGVVDPSPRLKRLVRAIAMAGADVVVHALVDEDDLDRFDSLGAVRPEAWDRDPPAPRLERFVIEAGMLDEATALDEQLEALVAADDAASSTLDPDSVAVVLADESRGPAIRRELGARGVDVHLSSGRPLAATPIARTIERLRDWCDRPDTHRLGELLGDAAFGAAVRAGVGSGDPEAAWISLAADRMPGPLVGEWWADVRSSRVRGTLAATDEVVRRLLGPFHPDASGDTSSIGSRPASAWAMELLELLDRVDEGREPRSFSRESLEAVIEVVRAIASVPGALDASMPAVAGIEMIVETVARVAIADPGGPSAVETIGWLEAPFDPAARLMVVGMHDAAVPGRIDDPILPDRLRTRLGLDHERGRTARDRWVLSTILARDPDAGFILSRRDLAGDPLVPSRLLFGVPSIDPDDPTSVIDPAQAEELAAKVGRTFAPVPRRRPAGATGSSFGRLRAPEAGSLEVPVPGILSVTAFRDYLASPYRFWLRKILRLDARAPVGSELDPRLFGIVLHEAVEAFARAEIERTEAGEGRTLEVDAVHAAMLDGMDASIAQLTGGEGGGSAALRLQRRIIERRLRRVAEIEVERAVDGWRIHAVEAKFDLELDIPGQSPQPITGRIDRIDRHPTHGWQLLDFKTSDKGTPPDKVHHHPKTGEWFDLQLPLYRWAAPVILDGAESEHVGTGYFIAGAEIGRIGVSSSDRIDGLFEDAMETAREVVRSIRAGNFADSIDDTPPWKGDPVALLMRTTALVADGGEVDA